MDHYRRPWWLMVNKPKGLVTTVREEFNGGEQRFVIRGEPVVQGLAWLIWGPIGALLAALFLTWVAVAFEIREQAGVIRLSFISVFLVLPAGAWAGVTLLVNHLSKKYLHAARQAEAQECIIHLDQSLSQLFYQTTTPPAEKKLAYDHIRQARVTHAIGERARKHALLTLNTNEGTVVLLNEALGTRAQKTDLARKIQQALETSSK